MVRHVGLCCMRGQQAAIPLRLSDVWTADHHRVRQLLDEPQAVLAGAASSCTWASHCGVQSCTNRPWLQAYYTGQVNYETLGYAVGGRIWKVCPYGGVAVSLLRCMHDSLQWTCLRYLHAHWLQPLRMSHQTEGWLGVCSSRWRCPASSCCSAPWSMAGSSRGPPCCQAPSTSTPTWPTRCAGQGRPGQDQHDSHASRTHGSAMPAEHHCSASAWMDLLKAEPLQSSMCSSGSACMESRRAAAGFIMADEGAVVCRITGWWLGRAASSCSRPSSPSALPS